MKNKFKIGDYFITHPTETNFGVITDISIPNYKVQWLRISGSIAYNDFATYPRSEFELRVRKLPHEEVMILMLEQ